MYCSIQKTVKAPKVNSYQHKLLSFYQDCMSIGNRHIAIDIIASGTYHRIYL